MRYKLRTLGFLAFLCAISVMAGNALSVPQDDRTNRQQRQQGRPQDNRTSRNQNSANNDDKEKNKNIKAQPIVINAEILNNFFIFPPNIF